MVQRTVVSVRLAPLLLGAALACNRGTETVGPSFAASANAPVHSITGGGKVDVTSRFPGFDESTISLTASVDGNGVAQGQLKATFSIPFEEKVHMELSCLAVDGNEAWIGGTVTKSHPNGTWLGRVFIVRFQDNGKGKDSPPDRMSHFRADAGLGPDRCLNKPIPANGEFDLHFPYVKGNIVIR